MRDRPALEVGKPRLGTLFLGRRGGGRPAMVHDTGLDIEVTVNFEHGDPDERRLIGRAVRWGDDREYSEHDYSMPEQVWFADPHGIICLVELLGRSSSFGTLQEVRLRFAYAVQVGRVGASYERINSMESRIEGLDQWMPIASVSHEYRPESDSSLSSVFTLRRQEPVHVSRSMNAQIRPTYYSLASPQPGQSMFADEVRVSTSVIRPRPWHEHLALHRGIRDLLVVAGWRDYGTWDLRVSRRDDPERALAGNVLGPRWAQVSTYSTPRPSGSADRSRFLFEFHDTGSVGLGRWLRLREQHRRGIAGMIHSVGKAGVALETLVSEAGAALEHLAYGIAVSRQQSPGRNLERHLRRVAADVSSDLRFDLETWPRRFSNAYNTVKHPDRPDEWSSLALSNVLRESRLLFRVWVAERIGVPVSAIEQNLGLVPMSRPLERW